MAFEGGGGGGVYTGGRNSFGQANKRRVSNPKPNQGQGYGVVRSAMPTAFRKPQVRAPRNSAPRGGGGGGGGYGGGPRLNYQPSGRTIGSNTQGRISNVAPPAPAPPPAPKPPSIDQWLAGDTTYGGQMSASKKALADYLAQMTSQQNQYQTDYERNRMGLEDQEKLATTDTENDYASRGMSTSGLYLKALADLKADYDKREGGLAEGQAAFLANLNSGKTNFMSQQQIEQAKYRQDAINRRAAQYGG